MSIFKCKICGGDLEISSDSSIAICQYCGTNQTLPHLSDERRANLYDRANHFRRNNDYDKAMGIYEQILSEDTTDAEAYWSIILCRYGIEYVKDGSSNRYLPTVNRMQYTSIYDDEDYKSAIQNADTVQREIYEADAREINDIQKEILSISQKEEPFDVFICYKETDANGRRTQDSVLATELYHELTKEGFKVFFSRITLEDKLGTAYEPYIFAALNSAKVMVVLGTKPEHFNAIWVKNEWSRYLALIKNGAKKVLIPAYRDMDPYDLPEEFSHLQAQDMSKLGFMQDLIRGIKKIIEADAPAKVAKETVIQATPSANVAPLLKRAFMFLEDGDFERADEFCEQVLNQDPECAEAYLGKLMVELKVKHPAELQNCAEPFDGSKNYQKAILFADNELSASLKGYLTTIRERNARKAEEARKENLYYKAMDDYKSYSVERLENAIKVFSSLDDYKDSEERIRLCQTKIDQIHVKEENDRIEAENKRLEQERQKQIRKEKAEKKRKKAKKAILIITPIVICLIAFAIVMKTMIIPMYNYNNAVALKDAGKYEEAITAFESMDGYKDSKEQIAECKYKKAIALMDDGKYEEAISLLKSISNYSDSSDQISNCETTLKDMSYEKAISIYNEGKYEQAKGIFLTLNGHKESNSYISKCTDKINENLYDAALTLFSSKKYSEAINAFQTLGTYKDSTTKVKEVKYAEGEYMLSQKNYSKAIEIFSELGDYSKASEKLIQSKYEYGNYYFQNTHYGNAIMYYEQVGSYSNAETMLLKAKIQSTSVNGTIIFGSYEQDNNTSNGKEEIEWVILSKENGKALLISKYCLDYQIYHNTYSNITWENCSLRGWLNSTFYNAAFSSLERNLVVQSYLTNHDSVYGGIDGGNNTYDKVFLLSVNEAKQYFSSDSARTATATKYATARGAYSNPYSSNTTWLLRTPGDSANVVSYVRLPGDIDLDYIRYSDEAYYYAALRPAVWIDISSIN